MIMAGSSYGPMPHWMVMKNMQMFSEEIMPVFREADGKPDYLREEPKTGLSRAEVSAKVGRPGGNPRSIVTGSDELIEHKVAHIPEVIDSTMGPSSDEELASAG